MRAETRGRLMHKQLGIILPAIRTCPIEPSFIHRWSSWDIDKSQHYMGNGDSSPHAVTPRLCTRAKATI